MQWEALEHQLLTWGLSNKQQQQWQESTCSKVQTYILQKFPLLVLALPRRHHQLILDVQVRTKRSGLVTSPLVFPPPRAQVSGGPPRQA